MIHDTNDLFLTSKIFKFRRQKQTKLLIFFSWFLFPIAGGFKTYLHLFILSKVISAALYHHLHGQFLDIRGMQPANLENI